MDQCTLNNLSLCSGGGGLDLGLELALGSLRTVCWVEWEAFAIEYLAQAMEAGCLAQAPVWTDLRSFDGRPWRGVVDCLTAGYPCQPFSLAGKRRGEGDPRHLWPHVARVIGEVEPTIVFLENVSGHLSLGFDQVASDLEGLGYEVAAGLFSAEEVGASQERERLFILAVENATNARKLSIQQSGQWNGSFASGEIVDVAHQSWMPCGKIQKGTSVPIFPPLPEKLEEWRHLIHCNPRFAPEIKSDICDVVDGMARIRLLGNGVVPLQAAYAFLSLWAALNNKESQ